MDNGYLTPKEKAVELVNRFSLVGSYQYIDIDGLWDRNFKLEDEDAVSCALIAVDEIRKSAIGYPENPVFKEYWNQVEAEIRKNERR